MKVTSKDQKIEDLQQELALTRVDFSTRLQKLEQKISALMNGNGIDEQSSFEQQEHKPTEIPHFFSHGKHQSHKISLQLLMSLRIAPKQIQYLIPPMLHHF